LISDGFSGKKSLHFAGHYDNMSGLIY